MGIRLNDIDFLILFRRVNYMNALLVFKNKKVLVLDCIISPPIDIYDKGGRSMQSDFSY